MTELEYLIVDHLSRNDIRRIFAKIEVDPVTHCWNWIASHTKGGYGQVWFGGKMRTSHRLIYAWIVEPLPIGTTKDIPELDHIICTNRACCNPAHVKLVPSKDNTLRGDGPTAINARKTHCKRGHLLPMEPNGNKGHSRRCKVCWTKYNRSEIAKERNRQRYWRNKKAHQVKSS